MDMPTTMRTFETGATRDSEEGKLDFEGFLSPLALERFAEYMNVHRKQADGSLRASDNWQKGMSVTVYLKSAWRHFFAWWKIHRGLEVLDERDGHHVTVDEAICGLLFNAMGALHEIEKSHASWADGGDSLLGPRGD
jgi:hypothetical protein